MAKERYGFRTPLTQTTLRQNINPTGTASGRYIPLGMLALWLLGLAVDMVVALVMGWLKVSTPCIAAWVVWGAVATLYLSSPDSLQEYRFTELPIAWRYLHEAHDVPSGDTMRVSELTAVSNMLDVRDEDECIFTLGDVQSYAYSVVGTASRFLFDSSRAAVADDWDSFLHKISPEVTLSCYTIKGGENVDEQVAALDARRRDLGPDADPELLELIDEQRGALTGFVAGRSDSIQQILVVSSRNPMELAEAARRIEEAAMAGEDTKGAKVSSRILRSARLLTRDDVRDLIRHFMGPLERGGED